MYVPFISAFYELVYIKFTFLLHIPNEIFLANLFIKPYDKSTNICVVFKYIIQVFEHEDIP